MDFLSRDLWERKWLDLWTVVHLATGMCFGFAVFFYNSPLLESFILFFVAMVIWEVLEHYHQAKEPLSNQFTDVVAGALGFAITINTVPLINSYPWGPTIYFTSVYIIAWLFAYFGFQSFAIHFHPEMIERYKKSFSAAVILYFIVVVSVVIF